MPFNYNDCIDKGLLRKIPASKDKAEQSLKKAHEWLEEAENSLEGKADWRQLLFLFSDN